MFGAENSAVLSEYGFLKKAFLIMLVAFAMRVKYYNGWLLGQLCVDASGLSYESKDGSYTRWVSVYPFLCELSMSCKYKMLVSFISSGS